MARKMARVVVTVLVVIVALVTIGGVILYLSWSEPYDDMLARANAMGIPSDFVLVSEKYSPGAMGLMGSLPDLERIYHAPWPGLCDRLGEMRDRLGKESGLVQPPAELKDKICSHGALYPAGWGGRIRSYQTYDVRIYAWEPGLIEKSRPIPPDTVNLTLEQQKELYPEMFFPAGHAKVVIQLIAHKGQ